MGSVFVPQWNFEETSRQSSIDWQGHLTVCPKEKAFSMKVETDTGILP